LLLAIIIAAGAGCMQESPNEESRIERLDLGSTLEWREVDGAVEYRIQLWAGPKLLFEEVREEASLTVSPVMERSVLGVTTAELQIRAIAADGEQVGEVQRQTFGAPDG
jgi:hypothetical protein